MLTNAEVVEATAADIASILNWISRECQENAGRDFGAIVN
jgi:hypothetical protein